MVITIKTSIQALPFKFLKKFLNLIFLSLIILLSHAQAQENQFSKTQLKSIKSIVEQYIIENPKLILQSLQLMREKEGRKQAFNAKKNIITLKDDIFNDKNSPVGGNPKGDVTIVEFFDYRCGYCKRVFPQLKEVVKADQNIKYIYKEFPILGPESVIISKIALSVWLIEKNKYEIFHTKLMASKGKLTKQRLLNIAGSIGVDKEAISKKMDSNKIENILKNNYKLAQSLNISGTPAFIINNQIIPGAIDKSTLRSLIIKARKS